MKKCILALATALALVTSNAAADGLVTKGQIKDHSQADAPFSWRGFYFGVHAGLATGTAETNSDFIYNSDTNLSGALYGVHAGYNWQRDSLVLGIEGAWSGSNIQGSDVCSLSPTTLCQRDIDSLATVVGRAGWAMNHTLLYGFGGLAWGDVNATGVQKHLTVKGSETQFGWIAGFGLEHAVSDRISFKIEYARIDLGRDTFDLGGSYGEDQHYRPIQAKIDTQLDTIRLGVNVKLGHGN
jgi:outer membrane immunogenic protein